jgi:glycosyltransferase involved in cell wall biosynthesis
MNQFYISSREGSGGITQYAKTFYNCVMKPAGYTFIDSANDRVSILSKISSRDKVHIEIGIFQKREIEILFSMLNANYKEVSITLHDPPLLKYPFREFENPILHNLSKLYDKYLNGIGAAGPLLKKIKNIYILSQKGVAEVKAKYGINNVHYLPHIIDTNKFSGESPLPRNFLYFGYIGPNKGLEYSLELHKNILKYYPHTQFYVIGGTIGKQQEYYKNLQKKYTENVHYLGYVKEDQLQKIFSMAMIINSIIL